MSMMDHGRPSVARTLRQHKDRIRALEATGGGAFEILLFAPLEPLILGDGEPLLMIPRDLDGFMLIDVAAGVSVADTGDVVEVMVRNQSTDINMLSTSISIDQGERTSYTAAVPPVINPAVAQVLMGQWLAFDVDDPGTDATGLVVVVVFG